MQAVDNTRVYSIKTELQICKNKYKQDRILRVKIYYKFKIKYQKCHISLHLNISLQRPKEREYKQNKTEREEKF